MMQTSEDKKYMHLAFKEASHNNCIKGKVGAIIVKDGKILGKGNNFIPDGITPCTEKTCLRKINHIHQGQNQELCRAIHAEQSAILNALLKKNSLKGSTLYTTKFPCTICTRMIIYMGVKKVIYYAPYPDEEAMKMLNEAKIELVQFKDEKTDKLIKKEGIK